MLLKVIGNTDIEIVKLSDKRVFVFHNDGFQQPVPYQFCKLIILFFLR